MRVECDRPYVAFDGKKNYRVGSADLGGLGRGDRGEGRARRRFVSGRADVGREREGWVPACARTTEGEGMTGEGWVTSPSPRGQALRGNNGRGRGFHCGMTGYTGTGGSRTARTGEGAGAWGQSIFIAITGEGAHEGRPYGGRWKGRPRGTPLRGRVERGCPRGTLLRAKGGKGVPTRDAPTGEGGKGVHEGRPYGGWGRFVSGRADVGREREGWVPACARTTEGEGMTGEGWVTSPSPRGQALRGNNGRGRGFHCGMTGYTGTGGSRTARTGEGAGAWGQSIFIAITGEGAHEGRPYGGRWKGPARGTPLRGKVWGRLSLGRRDSSRDSE